MGTQWGHRPGHDPNLKVVQGPESGRFRRTSDDHGEEAEENREPAERDESPDPRVAGALERHLLLLKKNQVIYWFKISRLK